LITFDAYSSLLKNCLKLAYNYIYRGRKEERDMKSIRLHRQGGPEELVYEDAPAPTLLPGDALVRVIATGITPAELTWTETYSNCDGTPRLPTIPGHEVSGVVERVFDDVSQALIGVEVYGLTSFCRDGCAAEYVAVHADDLAIKPASLGHTETAAVPLSALTAWQAFFDHAHLVRDQRVLIQAAAGGIGTFAVQIARWIGAYTIGVASAKNHDLLLELGADEVIDYERVKFEEVVSQIDLVLDGVGGETRERSWQVLKPSGMLISLKEPLNKGEAEAHGRSGVFFIVEPNRDELARISSLIDAAEIRPIISETFPLARAREAFERGVAGHNRGKMVLQVNHEMPKDTALG
jgi:NADPH:quinone reductase-like Zn-dependent oxidoreductase